MSEDNPKALPHVVTALIAKRAELAGQIEHAQGEVKRLTIALDNVESTLRLFVPDIDMGSLGTRPVPTAHHAFRGEVSRIVLETLRTAVGPLSTTALTEAVMKGRGLDVNDSALKRTMGRRVGACLNHWRRVRGVVKSMPGPGMVNLWEVVR